MTSHIAKHGTTNVARKHLGQLLTHATPDDPKVYQSGATDRFTRVSVSSQYRTSSLTMADRQPSEVHVPKRKFPGRQRDEVLEVSLHSVQDS